MQPQRWLSGEKSTRFSFFQANSTQSVRKWRQKDFDTAQRAYVGVADRRSTWHASPAAGSDWDWDWDWEWDDCGVSESHGNLQGAETGEEVKQVEKHFGSVCPAFV